MYDAIAILQKLEKKYTILTYRDDIVGYEKARIITTRHQISKAIGMIQADLAKIQEGSYVF